MPFFRFVTARQAPPQDPEGKWRQQEHLYKRHVSDVDPRYNRHSLGVLPALRDPHAPPFDGKTDYERCAEHCSVRARRRSDEPLDRTLRGRCRSKNQNHEQTVTQCSDQAMS